MQQLTKGVSAAKKQPTPNNRLVDMPNGKTAASAIVPQNQIALRAFQLWQARGCRHGEDQQDWLMAERELAAVLWANGQK